MTHILKQMTPRERAIYEALSEADIRAFEAQLETLEHSEIGPLRVFIREIVDPVDVDEDWDINEWEVRARTFLDEQEARLKETVSTTFSNEVERLFCLFDASPQMLSVCRDALRLLAPMPPTEEGLLVYKRLREVIAQASGQELV